MSEDYLKQVEQVLLKVPPAVGPHRAMALYRMQNSIWLWLGLAGIINAVEFFVLPGGAERSSVHRDLSGPVDELWNIFFATGGILIIIGIWTFRQRVEITGQLFFTTSIFTNLLAVLLSVETWGPTIAVLGSVVVASLSRVYWLIQTTPRKNE